MKVSRQAHVLPWTSALPKNVIRHGNFALPTANLYQFPATCAAGFTASH
jgi:hypothetical protein